MTTDSKTGLTGNKWLLLGAWSITVLLGYFMFGEYIQERVEGIDAGMIPLWPLVIFGLFLLASLVLTFTWARSLRTTTETGVQTASTRRRFLMGGAALTGGVVGIGAATIARVVGWQTTTGAMFGVNEQKTDPNPLDEWQDARIQRYRELGSTGLRISDISMGTTQFLRHPDPVRLTSDAIDRGINYIDTSPDYAGFKAENAIGQAIRGKRDQLFLATKWCTGEGHVRQGSSVETYLEALEGSLKRLGTDHVDLIHIHSCDSVERLLDPNVHEAFERAKQQGKVRFLGVTSHTPNLEEVARAAIDSDRFDVMMLAYHFGAWPLQQQLLEEAAAKGMGVVAMKTLKGAKHHGLAGFQEERDSYAQAAFKWVLNNPAVSALVISFFDDRHLNEYVYASGRNLTDKDVAILDKYDRLIAGTHCFAHCDTCLNRCPEQLNISDILRYRMYFEDYGDQKQAMQLYSKLEKKADLCADCAAPCGNSCPVGIDIKTRLAGAHDRLSFDLV